MQSNREQVTLSESTVEQKDSKRMLECPLIGTDSGGKLSTTPIDA